MKDIYNPSFISYCENPFLLDSIPLKIIHGEVGFYLEKIKSGEWKEGITVCRNLYTTGLQNGNYKPYDRKKKKLPVFVVSGIFESRFKEDCMLEYTRWIILDVDAKENPSLSSP